MITIFNRRELYLTWDLDERQKVRDVLISNNIKFIINARRMSSHSGGRSRYSGGRSGPLNMSFAYEYRFYVHKDDYECAKNATGLR
jgi:hypothetical protein